jgi:hypothetical protein
MYVTPGGAVRVGLTEVWFIAVFYLVKRIFPSLPSSFEMLAWPLSSGRVVIWPCDW